VLEPIYRIAVYLPNEGIKDIKLSNPEDGNPGIGGTQFLLFSLPYYIHKFFRDKYVFVYIVNNSENISSKLKVRVAADLSEAAYVAKEEHCDFLIFRPSDDAETYSFIKLIETLQLNTIAWLHTTPKLMLRHLNRSKNVVRCIAVGRDQYETLRDHPIINKLSLINNAVDSLKIPFNGGVKKKSVVFMGSLTFAKGFHVLARMWNKILKHHPDSELIIIGSGKLYDRNLQFGSLGLADERYERLFKRYVVDDSGNLKKSIKFMGIMGPEKYELMGQASVGIANHPGLRETFCLGAVEFQLCGTPVVSSNYGGLKDTVLNNIGGYLSNSENKRFESILKLLSDQDLSFKMGLDGRDIVKKRFNYQNITSEWSKMFCDLRDGKNAIVLPPNPDTMSKLNLLRECLRKLKTKSKFFYLLVPSIYILHTLEYTKLHIQKLQYRIYI
jgi:glycosyltransferase involved in cell wall biosynthesis